MDDGLFESAWFKWAQAVNHANALQDEFKTDPAINGDLDPLLAVRVEYHTHRHGFSLYADKVAAGSQRYGLMLGDVANNLQGALDHLAWALVARGKRPPLTLSGSQQRAVSFPIHDERTKFNGSLKGKLPGVSRTDIAKVRGCQPYLSGKRSRPRHLLVILDWLNRFNKHRTVQPIWHQPVRLDIEITRMRDCMVPRMTRFRRTPEPLKVDAELAFIRARKRGSEPQLDVKTRCTALPSIEGRIEITDWITQCALLIWQLLREFSKPPVEALDLAGEWLSGVLP